MVDATLENASSCQLEGLGGRRVTQIAAAQCAHLASGGAGSRGGRGLFGLGVEACLWEDPWRLRL